MAENWRVIVVAHLQSHMMRLACGENPVDRQKAIQIGDWLRKNKGMEHSSLQEVQDTVLALIKY